MNHEELRTRKLLLHTGELRKLEIATRQKDIRSSRHGSTSAMAA